MTSTPRRSGSRSAAALVARLALVGGLAGCGGDGTGDTATDPAPSSSPSPSTTDTTPEPPAESSTPPEDGARQTIAATGSAGVTEATLISATEGGGSASTLSFTLDTEQAVADFAAQFGAGLDEVVTATAAEVAEPGATTYGATAAIGCEAPRSVAIDAGEAGFEVVAKLPKSSVECLAPMTYVVLFAVQGA